MNGWFTSLNAGAWSNGADLKSAVFALVGSNPTSSTRFFVLYTIYSNKLGCRSWSNGADSKSAVFALVGSNPTSSIVYVAQWIERSTSNREAAGSSPAVDFKI